MMRLGPEKTGKFQGFGIGLKPAGGAAGGGVVRPGQAPAARRPTGKPAGGVADVFKNAMDDEGGASSSSSKPSWAKPSHEALQAQRQAEELLAQDPSVFQYDEVIDDIHVEREKSTGAQVVRTEALQQKKRVGLTLRDGSDEVRAGQKRQAKYIEKVIVATDRRKVEQQIIEDRLLKKEKDARKDCEVFVTEAFKEELKKRQKFVDELEAQEARDAAKAADKQQDGQGFANMYRNLLNGGLASSRGGEKVIERAPAREELKKEEVKGIKEEVKEELKEELPEEPQEVPNAEALRPNAADGEAVAGTESQDGANSSTEAKKARVVEEQAERAEKTMSARERFLARKKAAAAAEG